MLRFSPSCSSRSTDREIVFGVMLCGKDCRGGNPGHGMRYDTMDCLNALAEKKTGREIALTIPGGRPLQWNNSVANNNEGMEIMVRVQVPWEQTSLLIAYIYRWVYRGGGGAKEIALSTSSITLYPVVLCPSPLTDRSNCSARLILQIYLRECIFSSGYQIVSVLILCVILCAYARRNADKKSNLCHLDISLCW